MCYKNKIMMLLADEEWKKHCKPVEKGEEEEDNEEEEVAADESYTTLAMYYKKKLFEFVPEKYRDMSFLSRVGRKVLFEIPLDKDERWFFTKLSRHVKRVNYETINDFFWSVKGDERHSYKPGNGGIIEILKQEYDGLHIAIKTVKDRSIQTYNTYDLELREWRKRDFWEKVLKGEERWFVCVKASEVKNQFVMEEYRKILHLLNEFKYVTPGNVPPECESMKRRDLREYLYSRMSELLEEGIRDRVGLEMLKLLFVLLTNEDPLVETYLFGIFAEAKSARYTDGKKRLNALSEFRRYTLDKQHNDIPTKFIREFCRKVFYRQELNEAELAFRNYLWCRDNTTISLMYQKRLRVDFLKDIFKRFFYAKFATISITENKAYKTPIVDCVCSKEGMEALHEAILFDKSEDTMLKYFLNNESVILTADMNSPVCIKKWNEIIDEYFNTCRLVVKNLPLHYNVEEKDSYEFLKKRLKELHRRATVEREILLEFVLLFMLIDNEDPVFNTLLQYIMYTEVLYGKHENDY